MSELERGFTLLTPDERAENAQIMADIDRDAGRTPGHPGRVSSWKGHGPDPARWTCCRELVDGPHADGCANHHCRHEDEAVRMNDRYARLLQTVMDETRCLPDVQRRILEACE